VNLKHFWVFDNDNQLFGTDYWFDHIVPRSRGGQNTLENLGIAIPEANKAKGNLHLNEFLNLCEMILLNFGYGVTKSPENSV